MTHRGYIKATNEIEHPDTGGVISSTELRIHYALHPGSPASLWGDYPHPEEPAEIELLRVQREDGTRKWVDVPEDDGLWLWAGCYLENHEGEVFEDYAADLAAAAEYRAECRRESWS